MSADPHDPKFQKWMRSLEPRQELVIRFALREHFPTMRADRANDARVDELRTAMKLDEDRLAMILADARELSPPLRLKIALIPGPLYQPPLTREATV
jgi:hypothetical protein